MDDIKSKNMTIYENSSGNTAKSLQAIAGMHGIKFRLISALAKVEEQKQVLQIIVIDGLFVFIFSYCRNFCY